MTNALYLFRKLCATSLWPPVSPFVPFQSKESYWLTMIERRPAGPQTRNPDCETFLGNFPPNCKYNFAPLSPPSLVETKRKQSSRFLNGGRQTNHDLLQLTRLLTVGQIAVRRANIPEVPSLRISEVVTDRVARRAALISLK